MFREKSRNLFPWTASIHRTDDRVDPDPVDPGDGHESRVAAGSGFLAPEPVEGHESHVVAGPDFEPVDGHESHVVAGPDSVAPDPVDEPVDPDDRHESRVVAGSGFHAPEPVDDPFDPDDGHEDYIAVAFRSFADNEHVSQTKKKKFLF